MDPSLVLPIVFLFNGATLAVALDGIIQSIHVILSTKRSTILVLLLVTNALFFAYCCVNLAQITASMADCTYLTYVANFLGHATTLSLDYFVMFKCWVLCRESRIVGALLLAAFVHRLAWSICDMIMTSAVPVDGVCVYDQYPPSLVGFTVGDILCDFLATICSLAMNWNQFGANFAAIFAFIFKENIARSAMYLAINTFMLYSNYSMMDGNLLFITFSVVIFLYSKLLNTEFLLISKRREILMGPTPSTKRTPTFQADSTGKRSAPPTGSAPTFGSAIFCN